MDWISVFHFTCIRNFFAEEKNIYKATNEQTNISEGSEEATRRGWGKFGCVNGSNHESVAHADAGDETTKHEKGVVGREAHENGSDEENCAGENNSVATTYPVGGSSGEAGAD